MKRVLQRRSLVAAVLALVATPILGADTPPASPAPEADPQVVFRSACDRLKTLEARHAALSGVSQVKPSLQLNDSKGLKSANFVFERNAVPPGKDAARPKNPGKPFVYVSVSVWSGRSAQPPADSKTFTWKGQAHGAWVRVYGSDAELLEAIRKAVDEPMLAPVPKRP